MAASELAQWTIDDGFRLADQLAVAAVFHDADDGDRLTGRPDSSCLPIGEPVPHTRAASVRLTRTTGRLADVSRASTSRPSRNVIPIVSK